MGIGAVIALVATAAVLAFVIAWLVAGARAAVQLRDRDTRLAEARSRLEIDHARADATIGQLTGKLTETERVSEQNLIRLAAEHERYVAQVKGDQDVLKEQFKALAADVLKGNNEQFLEVADQRFKRSQQANVEELAKREASVKQMVEPMKIALDEVKRQTAEADKARAMSQAQMSEQVRQMLASSERLDRKTTDFINTLRRSDVRGNWGEVQLRRVVELSGMVDHVDFEEQENVKDAEGKNLRPDLTIKLAGGKTIVVDSKVALSALLEAFETDDDVVRKERLLAHARQVKKHVDDLASKKYWEQFADAPDFVIMFVPSEAFYQSALEQDSALQEYAFAKKVFIATPTTLVAMLRTVAHAWKEDALAKNARQVLSTGKELYDRLVTMGGHLSSVGKALEAAGTAYNKTVASLESRVLVSARRFGELQHLSTELPVTKSAELQIRAIGAPELVTLDLDKPVQLGEPVDRGEPVQLGEPVDLGEPLELESVEGETLDAV
jgi:DNA recombination protein RmuC